MDTSARISWGSTCITDGRSHMKTWRGLLPCVLCLQFFSGCCGVYVSIHGHGVRPEQRPEFAEVIGAGKTVVLKRTVHSTRNGKIAEDTTKDLFCAFYNRNVTDRDIDIPAYQSILPKGTVLTYKGSWRTIYYFEIFLIKIPIGMHTEVAFTIQGDKNVYYYLWGKWYTLRRAPWEDESVPETRYEFGY